MRTLGEASAADDFLEILWQMKKLHSIFLFYGESPAASERVKFVLTRLMRFCRHLIVVVCVVVVGGIGYILRFGLLHGNYPT